jgi:hypothetical protein
MRLDLGCPHFSFRARHQKARSIKSGLLSE